MLRFFQAGRCDQLAKDQWEQKLDPSPSQSRIAPYGPIVDWDIQMGIRHQMARLERFSVHLISGSMDS